MAASSETIPIKQYFADFHDTVLNHSNTLPISKLNRIVCNLLPVSTTATNSIRMDETFIADLEVVLEAGKQENFAQTMECVTNCYRLCRNVCAMCADNQTILHNASTFIELTHTLISNCMHCDMLTEDMLVFLRCSVQFLGNYCSGNKVNQIQIWRKFEDVFRTLLNIEDKKLREYVLMVVHITLTDTTFVLPTPVSDGEWQLLQACVQIASDSDSHNGLLVTEDCWKIPGFCDNLYSMMSVQSRLLLLEVLMNTLKSLPEGDIPAADGDTVKTDLPACNNVHYMAADFIKQSHLIPSLSAHPKDHLQVLCTVKELECLCIASTCHKLYGSLQDNEQLIKTAVSLLQCIDNIGKQGNNVFTNVDKVSNLGEVNTDHPVFGLKRDLIRLLANMAYKHRRNQDLVRELEGISLILDQTNIDGKNPFITQWSVFAIHNLTEENAENQRYIADLKLQGVANNQAVLDDMGLSAETQGQKVVIKKTGK